jgi:cobalt-zinc-cadmium efflux system outer membrane protein
MSRFLVSTALVLTLARLAEGAEPEPLRLDDVVAAAEAANPTIVAARARARAAAAMPARVSAWDDPTVSWESWNFPDSFRLDHADNNIIRLSQKIPFPGKRGLAGAVAEREADVARGETEAVTLDVTTAAKTAYWDLWHAHQVLHVYTRDRGLMERFARIAEQRYGIGEVSQADALRAQVELSRLANRTSSQALAIQSQAAALNALLSREPGSPLGIPEDPPAPQLDKTPDALIALALARRPELAARGAAIARDETGVRLAERDRLPDFEVAGSRFVNYGSRDGFGAFVSVTIPLAQKGRYDAAVSEAEARLAAARADRRRLEDTIRRDVMQSFLRARSALERRELHVTTHIPQTEQALRVTEGGYQTGGVDFGMLTETARALEDVHLEHLEAAADFEKAWAELERAVGTSLERGVAR